MNYFKRLFLTVLVVIQPISCWTIFKNLKFIYNFTMPSTVLTISQFHYVTFAVLEPSYFLEGCMMLKLDYHCNLS